MSVYFEYSLLKLAWTNKLTWKLDTQKDVNLDFSYPGQKLLLIAKKIKFILRLQQLWR